MSESVHICVGGTICTVAEVSRGACLASGFESGWDGPASTLQVGSPRLVCSTA